MTVKQRIENGALPKGITIVLDGLQAENVDFGGSTLVYKGDEHPAVFLNCQFPGTELRLTGASERTLNFLMDMANIPDFRRVVETILTQVMEPDAEATVWQRERNLIALLKKMEEKKVFIPSRDDTAEQVDLKAAMFVYLKSR